MRINYGDGTTGADVNAPHTYTGAGAYTASFDVATATQSALCSTPVRVEAAPVPTPAPTPPPSTANHAPTAVFNTTPDPDASDVFRGVPTFTVTFNMCRTTDPENDPMIPHTLVLKPGLVVHSIYNGYWFWGRPSIDDLWRDLSAASSEIRPDWDLSRPGLREAWDSGDRSLFHGWDRRPGATAAKA